MKLALCNLVKFTCNKRAFHLDSKQLSNNYVPCIFHVWSLDFGTSTTLAPLCIGQDIPLAARDVLVYRSIGFLLLKRVTTGTLAYLVAGSPTVGMIYWNFQYVL